MARSDRFEIAAAIATGVCHLVVSTALDSLGLFIAGAVMFWGVYVVLQARRDPDVWGRWGFRRANLLPATRAASLIGVVALAIMAAFAIAHDLLELHAHMLVLFVLYPVWGLTQHLIIQAMVARNLELAPAWIVAICALLFGCVHLPDLELSGATFLLGGAFTAIYLRWRNLWPLGLCHGGLGVFYYFWVAGRNPWRELVG